MSKYKYEVNCNASPVIPSGFQLVNHRRNGILKWRYGINIVEYFYYDGSIGGVELHRRLSTFPVHNANMLQFLIEHPELKSAFKEHYIKHPALSFWGTTYMAPEKNLAKIYGHSDSNKMFWVVPVLNFESWSIEYMTINNGWGGSVIALLPCDLGCKGENYLRM